MFVTAMDFWAKREQDNTKVTPKVADLKTILERWQTENKTVHKAMVMGDRVKIDALVAMLSKRYKNDLHLYRSKAPI